MKSPYSKALFDKLLSFYGEKVIELYTLKIDKMVSELESGFVGPYVYKIEWGGGKPVEIKPIFCDEFVRTGKDTGVALRENKYTSSHSFHQFIDCRPEIHRERQLNELLENE